VPCDYHHADDQQRNHDRGYGLCPWHHRGISVDGHPEPLMRVLAGPSKAIHPKEYVNLYGTEQELLDLQNKRIEEWEKSNVNSESFVTD